MNYVVSLIGETTTIPIPLPFLSLLGWAVVVSTTALAVLIFGVILFLPRGWRKQDTLCASIDKLREATDKNTGVSQETVRQADTVQKTLGRFVEKLLELHAPPGCPLAEKNLHDSDTPEFRKPNL